MTDETEGKEFSFDGMEGSVTLADLGGFNMDEVEEFRFGENLPVGRYDFEVVEATLKTRGEGEKEKPFVNMKVKVINVHAVSENGKAVDSTDFEKFLEREHNEGIYFNDLEQGIGQVKALLNDLGVTESGTLQELLAGIAGTRFTSAMKHRPSKDDKDIIYANLKKIEPLGG